MSFNIDLYFEKKALKDLQDIKNSIHKHPEISGCEIETTKKIKNYLDHLGCVSYVDIGLETGLIAVIKGELGQGPVIGIRADIDAIEQIEESDAKVKSEIEGVMHGCGHDFHTVSLLALAYIVSKNRQFKGEYVFIFQPSEETTTGARLLESKGLFKKIKFDAIIGEHNRPEEETGKVIVKRGSLMAAKSNFKIKIEGVSGHGSMPHKCIDPIVCASNIVIALQSVVSRNINPIDSCVLSIDYIHGGNKEHLVVDSVDMGGSVRCLSKESYERAKQRIEDIVSMTAKTFECKSTFEYELNIPLLFNDTLTNLAAVAAEKVVGKENVISTAPTLASEDFAVYSEYAETFFFWIGSRKKGDKIYSWHNRKFKTDDDAMFISAAVLFETAKLINRRK